MVKALFECKGDDCGEKSIVKDVSTIPGNWVVITVNQNVFDEDHIEMGTITYDLEFCCTAHAALKMADLEKLKARFILEEETEENG